MRAQPQRGTLDIAGNGCRCALLPADLQIHKIAQTPACGFPCVSVRHSCGIIARLAQQRALSSAELMTLVLVASLIGYMESMTVSMVCANKTAMNLNQTKNWSRRALLISWALSFTLFLRRGAWANVRQHSSWVQDTAGGNPLGSHHARCSRCPHIPLLSPPALGAGVYCALCRVWAP